MINFIKNNTWRLWLIIFITVGLGLSCQEANEPTEKLTTKTELTYGVFDQGGRPIRNARIRLAEGSEVPVNQLSSPYYTNNEGEVEIIKEIPIDGSPYTIHIAPPNSNYKPDEYLLNNVIMPCRDTSFIFTFVEEANVDCNDAGSEDFVINICMFSPDTTVMSKYIPNRCSQDMTFNVTMDATLQSLPGGPPVIRALDQDGNSLGLNNFIIPPGERFLIEISYHGQSQFDTESGAINISGSGSGNTIDYTVNLDISVDDCLDCDCPNDDYRLEYPNNGGLVRQCLGESVNYVIPLKFSNQNASDSDCEYIIELDEQTSFTTANAVAPEPGRWQYVEFNEGQSIIGAGSQANSLEVKFTPVSSGMVSDSAIFNIKRRDEAGNITECDQKLIVVMNGEGLAPEANIVLDQLRQYLVTTDSTFINCVSMGTDNKAIRIENESECSVDVSLSIKGLANGQFTIDGSGSVSDVLNPGRFAEYAVTFIPEFDEVWPNGRGNGPGNTEFIDSLIVRGSGIDTVLALFGTVDTACYHHNSFDLYEWDITDEHHFSCQINREDNSITKENNPEKYVGSRDIYVSSIDLANGTAVIESDFGLMLFSDVIEKRSRQNPEDTPCSDDWINDYQGLCDQATNSSVQVETGDVVMFRVQYSDDSEPYCGILWVADISNDVSGANALPVIKIEICFPL